MCAFIFIYLFIFLIKRQKFLRFSLIIVLLKEIKEDEEIRYISYSSDNLITA